MFNLSFFFYISIFFLWAIFFITLDLEVFFLPLLWFVMEEVLMENYVLVIGLKMIWVVFYLFQLFFICDLNIA